MFKLKSTLIAAAFTLSVTAQADEHHASPKSFKAKPVTDQITMLQGRGGNVAVLAGDQGLLMIDDDYKDMSPALQKALEAFGGEDKLTYIVNTHWHGDHTQGNHHFGHHAQIIAHDNVRERLLTSQEVKLFNMVTEPYPEHALPSITYKERMQLHMNGEQVSLLHLPGGHTDGDTIVHFKKANVVHMGDNFFNGFFPFVDVQNGGNVLKMAENIGQVIAMIDDDTKVIPGHGPLSNKAELMAFQAMLQGTTAEVQALKAKGMNLGAIQAAGLSDQWQEWTDGFLSETVWIGIVYASLAAQ